MAFAGYFSFQLKWSKPSETDVLILYSVLLIWLVVGLFLVGKIPLGTWRLNSFCVPAIGIMIINLLSRLGAMQRFRITAFTVATVLFLGSIGNCYATMAELMSAEHAKKLRIYHASQYAINTARQKKLPILVTSGIAYPFDDRWSGDWILRTLPSYKVYDPIRITALSDPDDSKQIMECAGIREAIILDGESVRILHR